MAEFEEKLNSILSDPEAMGQIVSIAKALTGGGDTPDADKTSTPVDRLEDDGWEPVEPVPSEVPLEPTPTPQPAQSGQQPDWSALMGILGGLAGGGDTSGAANAPASPLSALGDLDPRLIQTALRLFSEYSTTDDRKIALLTALKPFVKPERYAKVDKAVQIAKLSRVIRVAFQLFKKDGEGESHV